MNINLFGKQGSGKGTQGKLIAEEFSFMIFETGAQLREISQMQSELGEKVREIMKKGDLVSTEIVMQVLDNFLDKNSNKNIIFDGIPRSMEQYIAFEKVIKDKGIKIKNILIDISDELAIERLTSRKICKKCGLVYGKDYENNFCKKCNTELVRREDDNKDAIKNRLSLFEKETMPVIEKYDVIKIDGKNNINEIFENIKEKLKL